MQVSIQASAETADQTRGRARFTNWIIACLALWIIGDLGGRFVPVGWLHVLPEHEATRWPPAHAPFEPNLSIQDDHWIGETALKGNLSPTETREPLRFSTDPTGFRLTPGVSAQESVDYLLAAGASFAYGGGLSDDETFPAAFMHATGKKMYNGGRFFWDLQTKEELDWLLARLGNRHPAVVLLYWEQFEHARSQLDGLRWRTDSVGERFLGSGRYRNLRNAIQRGKRSFTAFWNISPVEVLSIRFFKSLSNDRLLPNRYKEAIEERPLPDGTRLLLLKEEVTRVVNPPEEGTVAQHRDYFEYWRDLLAERGCKVYVVLVPNKYSLYGPLLDGSKAAPKLPYLDRLEAALVRSNIDVVNGLTVLKPYASSDLASGKLAFYKEDHHWSPLGVQRLAAALANKITEAGRAVQ